MNYMDCFLSIERDLELNKCKLNGFDFWNYIRTGVYKKMVDSINNNGEAFDHYELTIEKVISAGLNCLLKRNYKSPRNHHDILIMCHPRRVIQNEKYESIYTDFLTSSFDTLSLEIPYRGSHYVPAASNNIYYLDSFYARRLLSMKIHRLTIPKYEVDDFETTINNICSEFKKRFNYDIDYNWICSYILNLYNRYVYTFRFFEKVITKTKPKLILEVVNYNFENLVINEVARKYGIKTIEFQHGVMGRSHCAYNYISDCFIPQLPDEIFFFSDAWKESVRLPSSVKRNAVGFNHFEEMRNRYKKKNVRKCIIFISSGTVGEELSRFAVEVNRYIKNNHLEYKIIYKLHPGEYSSWRKKYPWLLETGIDVVDNNVTHLYELFSESIAQVGVYSTALFEGIGYDLKTFILKNDNMEYVEVLFENSAGKIVSKAEEIFSGLTDDSLICDSSVFWTPNAKKNVIGEIEKNLS